ncbi:MAG: hypothetical protein ACJ70N_00945 [Nitrososphaera sp.]
MKPTGGAASIREPNTNRVTGFYREYECDRCGHLEGGHAKILEVNEEL